MVVTHCICADTPLAVLMSGAYPTLAAVKEETGCGTYCGLCLPWIVKLCRIGG